MVDVNIEAINLRNITDVNKCDDEFTIEARLILHIENGEIHYEAVPVPPSKKRYSKDDIDFTSTIDNPEKIIYLAYAGDVIAGQIILRKNWNNTAYIEDIAVDVKFRRQGIGRQLVKRAQRWARESHLAGIMLETQDNNVGACRFYESCGFKLRGFDTYLYKGLARVTDEIALYWYLIFGDE